VYFRRISAQLAIWGYRTPFRKDGGGGGMVGMKCYNKKGDLISHKEE